MDEVNNYHARYKRLDSLQHDVQAVFDTQVNNLEAKYQTMINDLADRKMIIKQKLFDNYTSQMNQINKLKNELFETKHEINRTKNTNHTIDDISLPTYVDISLAMKQESCDIKAQAPIGIKSEQTEPNDKRWITIAEGVQSTQLQNIVPVKQENNLVTRTQKQEMSQTQTFIAIPLKIKKEEQSPIVVAVQEKDSGSNELQLQSNGVATSDIDTAEETVSEILHYISEAENTSNKIGIDSNNSNATIKQEKVKCELLKSNTSYFDADKTDKIMNANIKTHISKIEKTQNGKNKKYQCNDCTAMFTSLGGARYHVATYHI